jgi:hypothetical protein
LFKFCCIVLFAVTGCSHTTENPSYPEPHSKEDCMELITDKLSVQEKRTKASGKMGRATARLNSGKIGVRKYRKKYAEWQQKEKYLRDKVTLIYDAGYEFGCFDAHKEW